MLLTILILAAAGVPVGMHSGTTLCTDLSGSTLFLGENMLSSERGSGINPLSDGDFLYWKECPSCEDQRAVRSDGTVVFEAEYFSGPFPSPYGSGFMAALPGEILLLDPEGNLLGSFVTDEYPGSLASGEGVIWYVSSEDGCLKRLDTGTGAIETVALSCTPLTVQCRNGMLLLEWAEGGFSVVDAGGGELYRADAAFMPRFLDNGTVSFTRWVESDGCQTTSWETVTVPISGEEYSRPLNQTVISTIAEQSREDPAAHFDVPYMHQRWDTPDWFNGSYSCGPTSCMMAVQYYNRLTPDSIWCSSPTGHWSEWGNYIPVEYTFLGCTYDILGLAAGSAWVPGAHGFICREVGGAIHAYMVLWMEQHGLDSATLGTSWGACTAELDGSWPVVASTTSIYTGGHILLFNGYYDNHSVICNDAYGNQNEPGWGSYYNGKDVVYDWPGYNNGNTQLGISQLFRARSEVLSPAGNIIDDRTLGYRKLGPCQYWHEQTTGYQGYSWWTYSTGSLPDTCVVEWIPELPQAGAYTVETFIPSSHSTATGIYHINTQTGWQTVNLNQGSYSNQWALLGTFSLNPASAMVRMGDYTGTQGQYISFDAVRFTLQTSTVQNSAPAQGGMFRPDANPVHASSMVSFTVPEGYSGSISVFDTAGRLIIEVDSLVPPGILATGVYHAVINTEKEQIAVRFTVID